MFKKEYFLIFLLFNIKSIVNIKSSDLCFSSNKFCKQKCEQICLGKHVYQCGSDRCSLNKQICDEHQTMLKTLGQSFNSIKYKIEKEKFLHFNNAIKKCPHIEYVFNLNETCVNGMNCYEKKESLFRSDLIFSIKKIDCPCRGEHSYQCGKNFCTLHNKACIALKQSLFSNNDIDAITFDTRNFKKCNNNLVVIKKISMFG
jgi:hypothetical protein